MTKSFNELDPEVVRKLLEGHENVIAPAVAKEQELLSSSTCPACNSGSVRTGINPKLPFVKGQILPNKLGTCLECGAEFDPRSRVILKRPTGE